MVLSQNNKQDLIISFCVRFYQHVGTCKWNFRNSNTPKYRYTFIIEEKGINKNNNSQGEDYRCFWFFNQVLAQAWEMLLALVFRTIGPPVWKRGWGKVGGGRQETWMKRAWMCLCGDIFSTFEKAICPGRFQACIAHTTSAQSKFVDLRTEWLLFLFTSGGHFCRKRLRMVQRLIPYQFVHLKGLQSKRQAIGKVPDMRNRLNLIWDLSLLNPVIVNGTIAKLKTPWSFAASYFSELALCCPEFSQWKAS